MRSNQLVAIENYSSVTSVVTVVLAIWLALVFVLGADGSFVRPSGTIPLPIVIGVTAPIIAFLAAFRLLRAFRAFVLAIDVRLATGIQAWRFAGFGFLALYAHGVLPGLFALPAGLGDIAIGVTAPWVILATRALRPARPSWSGICSEYWISSWLLAPGHLAQPSPSTWLER